MVLGGILLIAFIFWETVAPYPLFPKILFANKVRSAPFPHEFELMMAEDLSSYVDRHGALGSEFLVDCRLLALGMPNTVRP